MKLPEPQRGQRIYDLLKAAGMKLQDWPHANDPSRNQQWAWLEDKIAVVNVWTDMVVSPLSSQETFTTQYIARGQNAKGDYIDGIYKEVIRRNLPVHVLLKDRVTGKRVLDTELWSATYEDKSGMLSLVRGETDQFVDQHGDTSFPACSYESTLVKRSRKLRLHAMKKSGGKCEYCGEAGFRTLKGAIFAEVHHIVPLSENGSDELKNLIVLCPNDHRRAHHGHNVEELRYEFLRIRDSD